MTPEGEHRGDGERTGSRVDNVALQESAAQVIAEVGREKISAYLKSRIEQVADSETRIDLVASYALLEKEEASAFLLQLATSIVQSSDIRAASLFWLAKTSGALAMQPILSALHEPEKIVRITALRLITILPRMEAIRQLRIALNDNSEDIQAVAASMLLEIEATEAIELIERYFNDHPASPDAARANDFADKVRRERSRQGAEERYVNDSLYGEYD